MKTILVILGTRPEVIKLAPVILELKKYPTKYKVIICNTEQQKELSNQTLAFFALKADISLDVMMKNQSLSGVQSCILNKLSNVYGENKIDASIVQGDTITAFCGGLVSFYNKVPIFHIEAGLRSYDLFEPFPEEAMRQMIARITSLHFVPTDNARDALLQENIDKNKIIITGNTVVDALFCLSNEVLENTREKLVEQGIILNDKLVLITAHRRENQGERLDNILNAVKILVKRYKDHQFIVPVHPNPNIKKKIYEVLSNIDNIVLTNPLEYLDIVCLIKQAKLILTDSGGIQEEAPSFGCPLLVMRYETERKEGIHLGFAKLVGADQNLIIQEAEKVLSQEKAKTRLDCLKNPYGDGKASLKIEEEIKRYLN